MHEANPDFDVYLVARASGRLGYRGAGSGSQR